MNENKIQGVIQFSPIRSGSTLVFNIIKNIFLKTQKNHSFNYQNNILYFISIRHPYNSIISSALRYNEELNKNNIEKYINEYLKNGGKVLANENLNRDNIILFYYEEFVDDINYIFNIIENKFDINLSIKLKNRLIEELNINNITKISEKYKDFNEYDKNTHIHGNHISKYKGKTDYKELLNEELINILKNKSDLNKIIEKYYS